MYKSTSSKIKAASLFILSLILMILGVELIVDYYGGTENVPKWVYYTYMAFSLSVVGYCFAKFNEVFNSKK